MFENDVSKGLGVNRIPNINNLYRSPEAGPLLVKLYEQHKYALKNDNISHRLFDDLASTVAEILSLELSDSQRELACEVMETLMRQAEKDIRRAVSKRLSKMKNIPLRLVFEFANDDIEVAKPVLRQSPVLSDGELVFFIKNKSEDYWRAIAKRKGLSEQVVDTLVETGDLQTALNVSNNTQITLSRHASELLADMARRADQLANSFVRRNDVPVDVIESIYDYVGRQIKDYIAEKYSIGATKDYSNVQNNAQLEIVSAIKGEYKVTPRMIREAEKNLERGRLTISFAIDLLKKGKLAQFKAHFSIYCGVSINITNELLHTKTAQGLALMCRCASVHKSDYTSIFLLTSRLRKGVVINSRELALAMAYFDKIDRNFAMQIIKPYRH